MLWRKKKVMQRKEGRKEREVWGEGGREGKKETCYTHSSVCINFLFRDCVLGTWGVGIGLMPIHLQSSPNVLTSSQRNCPLHIPFWALPHSSSPKPGASTSGRKDPCTSLTSYYQTPKKKVRAPRSELPPSLGFLIILFISPQPAQARGPVPGQGRTGAKGREQRPSSVTGTLQKHQVPSPPRTQQDLTPHAKATDSNPSSLAFACWVPMFGYCLTVGR